MNIDMLPKGKYLKISQVAKNIGIGIDYLLYLIHDRDMARMLLLNGVCEVWEEHTDGYGGNNKESEYQYESAYVAMSRHAFESIMLDGSFSFKCYNIPDYERKKGLAYYSVDKQKCGKPCKTEVKIDNIFIKVEDAILLRDEFDKGEH